MLKSHMLRRPYGSAIPANRTVLRSAVEIFTNYMGTVWQSANRNGLEIN